MALIEKGNLSGKFLNKLRSLRSRTDHRHLSPQDVPKLRRLVQSSTSKNPSDSSDPRVVADGPLRSVLFCVVAHGAELPDCERLIVKPCANLRIKNRAATFQLDRDDSE